MKSAQSKPGGQGALSYIAEPLRGLAVHGVRRVGIVGACQRPLLPESLPAQTATNHEPSVLTRTPSDASRARRFGRPSRASHGRTASRARRPSVTDAERRTGGVRLRKTVGSVRPHVETLRGSAVHDPIGCEPDTLPTTHCGTGRSSADCARYADALAGKCTTRTTASRWTSFGTASNATPICTSVAET